MLPPPVSTFRAVDGQPAGRFGAGRPIRVGRVGCGHVPRALDVTLFEWLGRLAYRRRWLVVAAWVVLLLVAFVVMACGCASPASPIP